jgi:hypothetical protein
MAELFASINESMVRRLNSNLLRSLAREFASSRRDGKLQGLYPAHTLI